MIDDYDRVRPPKSWLYGVVLTILIFWGTGVFWESFRAHEITRVSFAGVAIMSVALGLIAHQALTNDDSMNAKQTLIARRLLMPLGILLFIMGRYIP